MLQLEGIESIVLEAHTRQYVQERVRAGVLEQGTADLMAQIGAGDRMKHLGLEHHGIQLRFGGASHRIDMRALTGRSILIYGQNELLKDLTDLRLSTGGQLLFEAEATSLHELDTKTPRIRLRQKDREEELVCDFIAGCDGFHGISRGSIPLSAKYEYERIHPFAWLGVLVQAPPLSDELIYTHHERGFALFSMRSPQVSRWYLQCAPGENIENWPDERVWKELRRRLDSRDGTLHLQNGLVLQKGITGMRSFVVEPMQHERLFLAGDAAHIVPPTGAKGLNLAIADTIILARALTAYFRHGSSELLERYSETCLRRVWKVQRFSWWMSSLLHTFPDANAFDLRRQLAELDYVTTSRAAATTLAENYVGLPLD